jgi:hypothetical protein
MENRENDTFQYKNCFLENRDKSPFFQMEKKVENRAYIYVCSITADACL